MIAIIGAGPAGAQAAYDLAKAGEQVHIFEDHHCVGEPVACTGLVTKTIHELLTKDEIESVLVNTLKGVDVIAPSGMSMRVPLHEYVLDRAALDRMLIKKAVDAGAQLHINHRFVGREGMRIALRHKGEPLTHRADVIIGADGPLSEVAKATGIFGKRKFYVGLQATLKGTYNKDIFTTWCGGIAPDFFAWSVPETPTLSRVGLATMENTRHYFEAFLHKAGGTVVAKQAGPIPFYDPALRASDPSQNTYLVGDAGGLAKATTGGGIITGMLSGSLLAECLLDDTNYENALAPLRRELWIHMVLRRALNRFSDQDYERLVAVMGKDAVRAILMDHPREYPSKFLFKLLRAEPSLLRFAPKGIVAIAR